VNGKKVKRVREIKTSSEKILDAPGLLDDYYLNLLDWSDDNVVAIALGSSVYLWNAETSETCQLMALENVLITSLTFAKHPSSRYLSIGTEDCRVLIWDINQQMQVRELDGHTGRVGSVAMNHYILSTGSFDGNIINHDVRKAEHIINTMRNHEGEVCGLKWSNDLLASGGNDNILNVWNLGNDQPLYTFTEHTAAVKAISWCPWQSNILASGGGSTDRSIKFWNTLTGDNINTVVTDSQVCSLQWNIQHKELISSHGFTKNQITIWKYPKMDPVAELLGHTSRVLHTAFSPDGTCLLTASPDQTIRIWRINNQISTAREKNDIFSKNLLKIR